MTADGPRVRHATTGQLGRLLRRDGLVATAGEGRYALVRWDGSGMALAEPWGALAFPAEACHSCHNPLTPSEVEHANEAPHLFPWCDSCTLGFPPTRNDEPNRLERP